jgi:hypothetical protein
MLAASMLSFASAASDLLSALPIRLVHHYPLITANVDGYDIPLQFDSGSSATVSLTQTVIDRIHARPTGEHSRGIDAKGHILEYPKFKVSRIQIGTEVFTDVTAELDVHDPSYQADQIGQQGFLGTSLLKPYKVVLDYPHRRMTLIPPGTPKSSASGCQGTVVSFAPQWHGEPATQAGIDLGPLVLWWDTGAPTSMLSARFVHSTRPNFPKSALATRQLMLGGANFGPWRFQIEDMALPPGFDGMLGYNFFARHIVCMDFPGNTLLVRH